MSKYYKFQIHNHTIASDGGSSLLEMAREAKACNLDGIILTDHNTITDEDVVKEVEEETGVLIIMGIEYTTFYGHVVSFGGDFYRWENIKQDNLNEVADFIHETNGVIGIAHPMGVGDPVCTGCAYNFTNVDYSKIDYIEVLHDEKNTLNEWEKNKEFYLDKVRQGYSPYHLYGGDFHNISYFKIAPFTNIIKIDMEYGNQMDNTKLKNDIINEIKNGRILPSNNIIYDYYIKANDKTIKMGDKIGDNIMELEVNIDFLEDFTGEISIENENGQILLKKVKSIKNYREKLIKIDSSRILFVELRQDGNLISMSNGIFIDKINS